MKKKALIFSFWVFGFTTKISLLRNAMSYVHFLVVNF